MNKHHLPHPDFWLRYLADHFRAQGQAEAAAQVYVAAIDVQKMREALDELAERGRQEIHLVTQYELNAICKKFGKKQ